MALGRGREIQRLEMEGAAALWADLFREAPFCTEERDTVSEGTAY